MPLLIQAKSGSHEQKTHRSTAVPLTYASHVRQLQLQVDMTSSAPLTCTSHYGATVNTAINTSQQHTYKTDNRVNLVSRPAS